MTLPDSGTDGTTITLHAALPRACGHRGVAGGHGFRGRGGARRPGPPRSRACIRGPTPASLARQVGIQARVSTSVTRPAGQPKPGRTDKRHNQAPHSRRAVVSLVGVAAGDGQAPRRGSSPARPAGHLVRPVALGSRGGGRRSNGAPAAGRALESATVTANGLLPPTNAEAPASRSHTGGTQRT